MEDLKKTKGIGTKLKRKVEQMLYVGGILANIQDLIVIRKIITYVTR